MSQHFWLAAGGTGGHISPGIALAEELYKKGHRVTFFTLQRNFDYPDIVGLRNSKEMEIEIYPAPRIPKSPFQLLKFVLELKKSWNILKSCYGKQKCQGIITMGGYPTFPILLFARLRRIPFFLCEQNSRMGMITRIFRKKAAKVFHSFPADKFMENEVLTGNPLRNIFLKKGQPKTSQNKISKILLLGGSQGAQDINELYELMTKDPVFKDIELTISCGGKNFESIQSIAPSKDRVFDFIYDIPDEMLRADLIISRAGSGLVYEIMWSKTPAVFLPYPHATDDHQKGNALSLVKSNAAFMIDIRPFLAQPALEEIKQIISDEQAIEQVQLKIHGETILPMNAHSEIPAQILEYLAGNE